MKNILLLAIVLLVLTSCESDDDRDTDSDSDTGVCGDIVINEDGKYSVDLEDRQNYTFRSSLNVKSTKVKSKSDIEFDWSKLGIDMLERKVDPLEGVAMVQVTLWDLTEKELMDKLNDDSWAMADLVAAGMIYTENAVTSEYYLNLLSPGGLPLDKKTLIQYVDTTIFAPKEHTYSVMLSSGTDLGHNAVMLAFFRPDPDETNTKVIIDNSSTDLEYTVDLHSLDKVQIPAGVSDITMDWTKGIELNSLGRKFIPTSITQAMLAHYTDSTLADLEVNFLDLEALAQSLWRIDIPAGTSAVLQDFTDDKGDSFSGIDEKGGIWIFALICGACSNPAPWFMTILEAC